MTVRIENADKPDWRIFISDIECPDDLNIATLIAQTLDFNYMYISRHHGSMAGTITDLVEHINDY